MIQNTLIGKLTNYIEKKHGEISSIQFSGGISSKKLKKRIWMTLFLQTYRKEINLIKSSFRCENYSKDAENPSFPASGNSSSFSLCKIAFFSYYFFKV
jgi:hypothetical protein